MQSCNSVDLVEQTSRAKCILGETFGCAKGGMMHVQNCRGTFRCDKGPIISCGYPPGAREYWCPCNGTGNGSMSEEFLHYQNRAGHVSGSCPCRSIGRLWSNNAGGSAINLSMAVAGVDNMRIWPELPSDHSWHMDDSLIRKKVVPFNRTGWVPTLIQSRDYWFRRPLSDLILPLKCGNSRGEDSVVYRSFFHDRDGRALPADSDAVVLEMGAVDGVLESNSRFFETCLRWRSVLVEPSANNFRQIPRNRPNATRFHAAVCESARTVQLSQGAPHAGTTTANIFGRPKGSGESVRCRPLWDILAEANVGVSQRRVDYFSLDVEGAESGVIRSMGTATSFGVVTVEVSAGRRRVDIMRNMLERGFAYVGQISGRPSVANYVISDVFYNRSHFARFWPRSRAAGVG